MSTNRKFNTARNTVWGLISKILSLIFPFVIRTIIIQVLGVEYVGLNSLFTAILQTLSLAELGFSSAIVFTMYKPIADNDNKLIAGILEFYKNVYRVIGLAILGCGLAILPFLEYLIAGDVGVDINIYILYLIYLSNTVISYLLFAYKSAVLQATQRNDIENKIILTVNLLLYVTQILLLIIFKNYYFYALAGPLFCIINNVVRSIVVDKLFPQYRIKSKISKDMKRDIAKRVKALFLYKVGDIVSSSSTPIIISAFLGVTILAEYSNYYLIITTLIGFLMVYNNAMTASIGNSVAVASVEDNYNTFNVLVFIQGWIIGFMTICYICLCQPFMDLWVGKELMLDLSVVILLGIYFYTWKINDIVCVYKDATGLWHPDRYRPLIEAFATIVLSVVFIQFWGVNGAVFGFIASLLIVTWSWMPSILYKKYFNRKVFEYYKTLLFQIIINAVLCLITYMLCNLAVFDSLIITLLIRAIICLIIPNLILLLLYFKSTKFKHAKKWIIDVFSRGDKK